MQSNTNDLVPIDEFIAWPKTTLCKLEGAQGLDEGSEFRLFIFTTNGE